MFLIISYHNTCVIQQQVSCANPYSTTVINVVKYVQLTGYIAIDSLLHLCITWQSREEIVLSLDETKKRFF